MKYNPSKIESKWQRKWSKDKLYIARDTKKDKENYYLLTEFPYPSGNLHIGHWYAFSVPDIFGRYVRMRGKNVMYPIGFDSFGLPAENAAIKRDLQPEDWTNQNIKYMTGQLESMGASFDWSRKVITSHPDYYKWTQWLFIQFYKNGLVRRDNTLVNWCPSCKTVLANEQVVESKKKEGVVNVCERCGTEVQQREMIQWMLKTTKYAKELTDSLENVDWPEATKLAQKNWIGKSEGTEIEFKIKHASVAKSKENKQIFKIKVFTTRPDTLFGATYLVLSPDHKLIQNNNLEILNKEEVNKYIKKSKQKTEQQIKESRTKTGVELKGIKAVNPANNEEIPVWIADYVVSHYGTGAIMAVPAHDERDFEFAVKQGLPIREVVVPNIIDKRNPPKEGKKSKERKNVHAIVKDPNTGQYLALKWTKFDWITFPMGGIEEGEDVVTAAKREVKEETGFCNLKLIKVLEGQARAEYFAAHKDENRVSFTTAVLFELIDNTQSDISKEEKEMHEVVWIDKNKLNYQGMTHAEIDLWAQKMHSENPAYTKHGILINSGKFNGMDSEKAKWEITKYVKGEKQTNYKLHDWIISRQRYWGVPIPMIYCPNCGYKPVKEKDLPLKLPRLNDFKPTDDGKSPLAKVAKWVKTTCPHCGNEAERETDTMDTFVDSSWYFLRYSDPQNKTKPFDGSKLKKWLPVNMYIGGAEHNTMHLLYSRFFTKAMHELKLIDFDEPFASRRNHGIILGPDSQKMSKSRGNVIDPDDLVKQFGADTVRIYLAFMGPYDQGGPWSPGAINGVYRFLNRVWNLFETKHKIQNIKSKTNSKTQSNKKLEQLLHKTIKKVGEDIEEMRFNTAVSELMKLLNEIEASENQLTNTDYELFAKIIAPFAPHLADEIWHELLGRKKSIHLEKWPKYNSNLVKEHSVEFIIQINGKLRDTVELPIDSPEETVKQFALKSENVRKHMGNQQYKKAIFVPNKLINFVL
ncbi:MAG: leucine--tRNA ligase [Candidatus Yanofskybacteria bacterium CG10_big_fil_rev_8_21_14_0_10_36_16]|uniref:Leucine--tRNA ligase n=1 Tax=Candidatus Yanofskybacteria bacterium CG10_big_fil_rev_8_21_14_0_10_36_16 TaxID=1975096 RepID=A0A2J0Q6R4_9BACT|nr:MAG: leucine--tRNA ligase [Candidatus Yanofskybacteria bacterium CG10_big_fil_rev_8_21_14_0_10_36_16]